MTIRTRFLLAFIVTIFLITGGVVSYVTVQMRSDAEEYYASSSSMELGLMNDFIEEFITTAINNASIVATTPGLADAQDLFPRFADNEQESPFRVEDLSLEAQLLLEPLAQLDKVYNGYVEVYAGFADGSMATSLVGMNFPAHFDMSKRPWYVARAAAAEDVGLSDAYTSYTGDVVFAITHKLKNSEGKMTGVLGIDVSLQLLADKFAELSKKHSGYFVLIEHTGRILCDPLHPESIGKVLGKDFHNKGMEQIFRIKMGNEKLTLNDENVHANVITNAFGWKLIYIQSDTSIYMRSNTTVRDVAIITAVLAGLAILVALLVAYSINKPLQRIVSNAHEISEGNLDKQLAPEDYYGELSQLQQALSRMVDTLKQRISEACEQSALAKKETARAQEAVAQAEEERQKAETSRHEGMLAAARLMMDVLSELNSASSRLTAQIEKSERGVEEQASRVTETVTAMKEMNTTVADVARNAGLAAEVSSTTRQKAEDGENVVSQAVISIHSVKDHSLKLRDEMRVLEEQAKSITSIVNVISDIADQTNLLALNAAIEAARAGEAGRGFAVVADEVRKLAEKTMTSTTDVGNAIKAIQQSAAQSVEQMDITVRYVDEATNFASQSGEALRQIVAMADSSAEQVRAIAAASEQQAASSAEISNSINQVDAIAGESALTMREAADTVNNLTAQTRKLTKLIEDLKK